MCIFFAEVGCGRGSVIYLQAALGPAIHCTRVCFAPASLASAQQGCRRPAAAPEACECAHIRYSIASANANAHAITQYAKVTFLKAAA